MSGNNPAGTPKSVSEHDEVRADDADDPAPADEPGEEAGEEAEADDQSDDDGSERLSERITQQLAHQWALIRAERRHQPEPIVTGPSNVDPARVPWGLDLAAAWSWRLLIIGVAAFVLGWVLSFFAVLTLPVIIALLIAALTHPIVDSATKGRVPRGIASLVVVAGGLTVVGLLLSYVGQEIAGDANKMAAQVAVGLQDIREWLTDGPLNLSDSQVDDYLKQAEDAVSSRAQDEEFFSQITEVGAALGHVVAGFFIVLFSTYFFLADGNRIWAWLVRLAPRAARAKVDASGRVAWTSLTKFVRATVIVALVDAIGIMIVAAVLRVPFVIPIGVLVFLGAFVPMIGATIAGSVAVLVALVDQGPLIALLMLAGVIVVQQIEGHILQPFLMGRWVSLHPLGVILAIGAGVLVGGIAGALIAVPLAAAVNAVVLHLADHSAQGADPAEELAEDYAELGASVPMKEPEGSAE